MDGALQCADSGVASSLLPSNLKAAALVGNAKEAAKLRLWRLLFDPQTSGGLLAGWASPLHALVCIAPCYTCQHNCCVDLMLATSKQLKCY